MTSHTYPIVYPYHHATLETAEDAMLDPTFLHMAKLEISQPLSPTTVHYNSIARSTTSLSARKRTRASPEQLCILEKTFSLNPSPNNRMREHLSMQLGMSERSIQIWFQNRRAKVKNMAKRSNMMQDQIQKMQQVAATAAAAACQAAVYQQQQQQKQTSPAEDASSPSLSGQTNPDLYYYYYYYYFNQQQQQHMTNNQGAADSQRHKAQLQPPPPPPPISMLSTMAANASEDADVSALRLSAGVPPPPPLAPQLPLTIPVAEASSSTSSSSHTGAGVATPLTIKPNPWMSSMSLPLSLEAQASMTAAHLSQNTFHLAPGRTRAHSVGPSFHVGNKKIHIQDERHASLGPPITSTAMHHAWADHSPIGEGSTGPGLRIDTNILQPYSSSWTEGLPYSCPLPTAGAGSSHSSQLDTPMSFLVDDDELDDASRSHRLPISAESLQIGSWKRMALRPCDLKCFIQIDTLVWRIQDGGQLFKMELLLENIQRLELVPLHNNFGWARLEVRVTDPTNIRFYMMSNQTDNWMTCHDFTQDMQATTVAVHHIEGPESLLRVELERVASVNARFNSCLVLPALPAFEEGFKASCNSLGPMVHQEDLVHQNLLFQDIAHPV